MMMSQMIMEYRRKECFVARLTAVAAGRETNALAVGKTYVVVSDT